MQRIQHQQQHQQQFCAARSSTRVQSPHTTTTIDAAAVVATSTTTTTTGIPKLSPCGVSRYSAAKDLRADFVGLKVDAAPFKPGKAPPVDAKATQQKVCPRVTPKITGKISRWQDRLGDMLGSRKGCHAGPDTAVQVCKTLQLAVRAYTIIRYSREFTSKGPPASIYGEDLADLVGDFLPGFQVALRSQGGAQNFLIEHLGEFPNLKVRAGRLPDSVEVKFVARMHALLPKTQKKYSRGMEALRSHEELRPGELSAPISRLIKHKTMPCSNGLGCQFQHKAGGCHFAHGVAEQRTYFDNRVILAAEKKGYVFKMHHLLSVRRAVSESRIDATIDAAVMFVLNLHGKDLLPKIDAPQPQITARRNDRQSARTAFHDRIRALEATNPDFCQSLHELVRLHDVPSNEDDIPRPASPSWCTHKKTENHDRCSPTSILDIPDHDTYDVGNTGAAPLAPMCQMNTKTLPKTPERESRPADMPEGKDLSPPRFLRIAATCEYTPMYSLASSVWSAAPSAGVATSSFCSEVRSEVVHWELDATMLGAYLAEEKELFSHAGEI